MLVDLDVAFTMLLNLKVEHFSWVFLLRTVLLYEGTILLQLKTSSTSPLNGRYEGLFPLIFELRIKNSSLLNFIIN